MKMESVNLRSMRMTIVNVREDNGDSGRRMVNMMMMMIRIMSPDITRLNLVHTT